MQTALAEGSKPALTEEGTGGTYMIVHDYGDPIGFFKPKDEEVNAPNNPRGRKDQALLVVNHNRCRSVVQVSSTHRHSQGST